jgi:Zn-dependent protease with chaperone function
MVYEMVGLFLFLAGFIVGLGAVTVIDIHGFLGRTSPYWNEATIRTHKVTKPLIWLGTLLAIVGGTMVYWGEPFTGIPLYHSIIAGALVLNGMFLSLYISPQLLAREKTGKARELLPFSLQWKIAFSLIISDVGWWGALVLLVVYVAG